MAGSPLLIRQLKGLLILAIKVGSSTHAASLAFVMGDLVLDPSIPMQYRTAVRYLALKLRYRLQTA